MSIARRVASILNDKGQTVTYKQATGKTRSTTTLENTVTYTSHTIQAHFRLYDAKELSGSIEQGDRQMRIAAEEISFVPKTNDRVVINTKEFNVKSVDIRNVSNSDVLYICQIRGTENNA